MKKLTLLLLAVVTAGSTFTACKKTEKIDEKFYYEYDNDKTDINYVELIKNTGEGLTFILSNEILTKDNQDEISNKEYLTFDIPDELLDKKVDLNVNNDIAWYPSGRLVSAKKEIDLFWTDGYTDANEVLTGDNNWMKATKNSDNNYTLELDVHVNNKHIKGYYKGEINTTLIRNLDL